MAIARFSFVVGLFCLASSAARGTQEAGQPAAQADAASLRVDEVQRRVLKEFRDETAGAKAALTALQEAAQKFSGELKELLTNDAGRRVARDPLSVMAFIQIREEPAPSAEQVKKKLDVVDAVLAGVDARLKQARVDGLPSSQQRRDVLDAYSWAKARADRIADRRDSLQALIVASPSDIDVSAAITLDAAVSEYKSRFSRLLNEGWQKGEARAAGQAQQVMVDTAERATLEQAIRNAELRLEKLAAENQRLRVEQNAELLRLREEQDKRLADMDRELEVERAARLKQEAETAVMAKTGEENAAKVLMRKKCQDPETKRLLAPFLAHGYAQPGKRGGAYEKGPVSLSATRQFGALEPTVHGLGRLLAIGVDANWDKERPRWGYRNAVENMSGPQRDEIKKAQQLLIELGDTLVELGMLAP